MFNHTPQLHLNKDREHMRKLRASRKYNAKLRLKILHKTPDNMVRETFDTSEARNARFTELREQKVAGMVKYSDGFRWVIAIPRSQ
jgi:hypothetical protein